MIPIMRLPGGSRAAPKQVQKWPERTGREDWLGGFMMVSRSGQGDGCACSLNFPQVSKQGGVRLFFFLIIICFVYLVLAVLGLHCCAGFSLVVASGGYSPVAVSGFSLRWLLIVTHGLWGTQASAVAAHGPSS